ITEDEEDSAINLASSQQGDSLSDSKKNLTNNVRNAIDTLESYHMFIDQPSVVQRNEDFINGVKEILCGDRSSVTSQATLERIEKAQLLNAWAMENTYASEVLPLYIGSSRTVKPTSGLNEHVDAVIRDFAEDRLHKEGPCYFIKDMLFGPRTKKEIGVSDPRPDVGFGIRKRKMDLDVPTLSEGTKLRIRIAGCIDHCFCLGEIKGPDDPFAHALIQALRGGVTLVRAKRDLRNRAGYSAAKVGPDQHSWVFIIAFEYRYAEICVCWHESFADGKEADHMHRLESYKLLDVEGIKQFRRDLHNILDWGLDPQRVADLEQMVRDIAAKEKAQGTS
ncbi:MAG: hypothetical protein LQ337_007341, partial [Flavoplaca oasis]